MQTAVEALDDDALFGNDEDEEEEGAFVMYALTIFPFVPRLTLYCIVGVTLLMLLVTTSLAYVNSALHPSLVCQASASRRNFLKARTRVEMNRMLLRTYPFPSVRTPLTTLIFPYQC
jgi:hypothetical protein